MKELLIEALISFAVGSLVAGVITGLWLRSLWKKIQKDIDP